MRCSPGVRRQLIPILDWRSARTWRVFVGLAIIIGTVFSIVVMLFGAAVDRIIDDHAPQAIVKFLVGYPALAGIAAIGAQALRRVLPLRNTAGEIVAERSIKLGMTAILLVPALAWALCFLAVFTGAAILARDLAWAFADGFPFSEMTLTAILSFLFYDLPLRGIWRVPCKPEISPGDE